MATSVHHATRFTARAYASSQDPNTASLLAILRLVGREGDPGIALGG